MTATTPTTIRTTYTAALELLAALPLEDGTRWGERAEPFQIESARAILDTSPTAPRRHFDMRGRGMSKTTDTAAVVLVLLLTKAPASSTSHVYAADEEQAELTLDAMRGFIDRAQLGAQLRVSTSSVTNTANGATFTIETSDGASAFGKRPWLQVVDELAVWPNTSNARTLWSAIVSAVPKVRGSRLIVITTAGSPTGICARVWAEAETSPHWRTSKSAGPAPWWSADDIEATRAALSASEWRRLILCEWAEGDDALTSPEDVEAAIRSGSAVLPKRTGVEYVAALDVGTRRDLTALVVGILRSAKRGASSSSTECSRGDVKTARADASISLRSRLRPCASAASTARSSDSTGCKPSSSQAILLARVSVPRSTFSARRVRTDSPAHSGAAYATAL